MVKHLLMSDRPSTASPTAIWAALLSVYIVWGSTYLAIRFAVETIPPFLMAGARFLVAGAIMYLWRILSGDRPGTLRQWRSAAVIGLLLLLGGNGLVSWAEQHIVSGVAALLVGTVPLWIVLIDAVLGHRMPRLLVILGVLVGFGGIALLVGPWQETNQVDIFGALAVIVGASLWAGGSIYSRSADLPASPLLGTGMEMLCGAAGLVIAGTLMGEWSHLDLAAVSLESAAGLGYLIVFGSLVGFASYTWLLRNAPTPLVATYAYVNPLVAVLLGALLANEVLNARVITATLVIIGSVVLITRTQVRKRRVRPQISQIAQMNKEDFKVD